MRGGAGRHRSTSSAAGRHRAAPAHTPDLGSASEALTLASVALAVVAGAALASWSVPRPAAVAVSSDALHATLQDAAVVAPLQDPAPVPAAAERPEVVPARVVIPDIGVDAALPPLSLDEHSVLVPPAELDTAGWYSGSAVPGQVGPSVLAGHVDDTERAGVFARLAELRPGARIEVVLSDGTTFAYRMLRALDTAKAQFPTAEVYGPTPNSQLRLITCIGPYDFGAMQYSNNLVVFAVPW